MVGCACAVCLSEDPRNKRLRPGIRLDFDGGTAVVDTSPDFREQALRFGIPRVDAVLYTHSHADHVFGLDDLRPFNFKQRAAIPCYGSPETVGRLRQVFAYAFEESQQGGGKPRLDLVAIEDPFELFGETVTPVPVQHGDMRVYGYRTGGFAVVTDVNHIPEASLERLGGLDLLILSALRYRPHPTHYSVDEALAMAARIGARRTLFTHIAHEIDHETLSRALPPEVELGYDGLVVDLG
jgi:phosphoribosyl 1,2-cyclic phosphate phosphodiesterase